MKYQLCNYTEVCFFELLFQKISFRITTGVKEFRSGNSKISLVFHVGIQRGGGTGGPDPPPLKNHKNIGFLGPWKITKLPSQHSMLGHHRPASETPMAFHWRADDGLLLVLFGSSFPSSKKQQQKRRIWWTPLAKLSGSVHVFYHFSPTM